MANSFASQPMILDTDTLSYRTTSGERLQGIRVQKLTLAVGPGGASTAGNVTITAPSDSSTLFPPMAVPGASAANTILFVDNPDSGDYLTWRDFAVTGLTATGTRLFLWWTV